jgi:glycosyltransferase 2 family protein
MNTPVEATGRAGAAKNALLAASKLGLAIGLLVYLIWRGDLAWDPIRASLDHWQINALALALLLLTPFAQLWRWQSLLRASRFHLPTREVFSYLMVAKFLNMALPGYIGGDVLRGFYVSRRAAGSRSETSAEGAGERFAARSAVVPSIVFDRVAGLVPLFVLALIGAAGAIWYSLPSQLLLFVATLSAGGLLTLLALFWLAYRGTEPPAWLYRMSEKLYLHRLLATLYESSHEYVRNHRLMRNVLGISFFSQGLILLSFVLFGTALDMQIPLIAYVVLVPLGLMVTAIPISPAGLGVGQVAFLALFRMAGTAQGANLFTFYMASSALVNLSGAVMIPFFRLHAPLTPPASLAHVEEP